MDTVAAISLPAPTKGRDNPALAILEQRRTTRDISDEPLPLQALANLLWAACGVNRPVGPFGVPGRTAGSASNSQEIDVYVALRSGAYRYDPLAHRLDPVYPGDLRSEALIPIQAGFGSKGGVQLIYVADPSNLTHGPVAGAGQHDEETRTAYCYVDVGLVAGNVSFFAAAVGLAAWFHGCDRAKLARHLGLRPEQRVLFAHSIGYPVEED